MSRCTGWNVGLYSYGLRGETRGVKGVGEGFHASEGAVLVLLK